MLGAAQAAMLGASVKAESAHRYWRLYPVAGSDGYVHTLTYGNWHHAVYEYEFFSSNDGSGSDLTTGKTAAASTEYSGSFVAGYAIDNNASTYWSTAVYQPSEQWWKVDLGTAQEVHSISITGYAGGYHCKNYQLQYSDDNANWTTQSTFATSASATKQIIQNL